MPTATSGGASAATTSPSHDARPTEGAGPAASGQRSLGRPCSSPHRSHAASTATCSAGTPPASAARSRSSIRPRRNRSRRSTRVRPAARARSAAPSSPSARSRSNAEGRPHRTRTPPSSSSDRWSRRVAMTADRACAPHCSRSDVASRRSRRTASPPPPSAVGKPIDPSRHRDHGRRLPALPPVRRRRAELDAAALDRAHPVRVHGRRAAACRRALVTTKLGPSSSTPRWWPCSSSRWRSARRSPDSSPSSTRS